MKMYVRHTIGLSSSNEEICGKMTCSDDNKPDSNGEKPQRNGGKHKGTPYSNAGLSTSNGGMSYSSVEPPYRIMSEVATIPEEEEFDVIEKREIDRCDVIAGSVKPVPSQRWDFILWNYFHTNVLGEKCIPSCMSSLSSTVFRLSICKWPTMVCDYLGLKSLLDYSKVARDDNSWRINTRVLRGHVPCILDDDKEHVKRTRKFLANFFKERSEELCIKDLAEYIQLEFEKMKGNVQKEITDENKELCDIENAFKKAVVNVVFSVFLGEYMRDSEPDHEIIYEWREYCKKYGTLNSLFSVAALSYEKSITNELFTIIENTIKLKELKVTVAEYHYEQMLKEIVYAIAFVAIGDLKDTVMSCLYSYLRLSEKNKREIKRDAEIFFNTSNNNLKDKLPELKYIHAFYMEVIRLYPLVPRFFRRAKTDFVLRSTSGNFQIYEDDFLCGYPYIARRDPKVFKNPNKISLDRCLENERYDFAYGGLYADNSIVENYGIDFEAMFEKIVKLFILFLTKCTITPSEIPVYNENDLDNPKVAVPMKVKNFYYER